MTITYDMISSPKKTIVDVDWKRYEYVFST